MRSPSGRNSSGRVARYNAMMPRIIRYEPVPHSGSYEVRFTDGRESNFFIGTTCRATAAARDAHQRKGAGGGQGAGQSGAE